MRALILSFLALLISASPLLGQDPPAAEHAGGGLLDINVGVMFWTLVIFLGLMFILRKYAFGPITAAVVEREKALEAAIAGAKRDRDEAAKLLEQHRAAIEAARADAQRMIAEGRAAGEKLKAEMLEETRAQQQETVERARREIDAEKEAAIREMRSEAVELAIAGASRVIEKNLDDRANRQLIESYLASLGKGTH
jgi:F-type H+-transporting ATPase subunit b